VVLGAARRGVHFIMKFSLGQGFGGLVLRAAGQVPVGPAGGREALAACLGLLGRGRLIGIFPEGTRGDGQMRQIRAGVAWLAVNSGAPVIPFACLGTRHSGEKISKFPPPGRRICVAFGPPVGLDLDSEASPRDQVAAALEQIGSALAAHVAQASRDSGIELPSDTGRKPSE
jgi:1-acyl-sn-glycerol-3-phosphate acyltransferase